MYVMGAIQIIVVLMISAFLGGCSVSLNRAASGVTSSSSSSSTTEDLTPSASTSSITGTNSFSDGSSYSTITVSIKNASGTGLSGYTPTFSVTGSNNTQVACTSTDSSGNSTCYLKSTTAETKTLSLLTPVSVSGGNVTFTSPSLSLQVPIELLDTGVTSRTTAQYINRSLTEIDPSWYDGVAAWYFEIVAVNGDTGAKSITLTDQTNGDAVVATASISNGTSATPTRVRVAFSSTPVGTATYRLQLPATTSNGQVSVYAARVIVEQTNATKTGLYFPLLSETYNGAVNPTSTTPIATTVSTTYTQPSSGDKFLTFRRNDSGYAKYASGTPWHFHAIISNTGDNTVTAYASLFNNNSGSQVTDSEVSYAGASTTPQLVKADMSNSATNFTQSTNYVVKIKSTSATVPARLYKAGLWLQLTSLSKATVVWKVSGAASLSAGNNFNIEHQRVYIDSSKCTNATYIHDQIGYAASASDATVSIMDNSTNETVGATTPSTVASSTVTMSTSYTRTASSSISLTSGDRFIVNVTASTNSAKHIGSFIRNSCETTP